MVRASPAVDDTQTSGEAEAVAQADVAGSAAGRHGCGAVARLDSKIG
jgi:hypothetical protein